MAPKNDQKSAQEDRSSKKDDPGESKKKDDPKQPTDSKNDDKGQPKPSSGSNPQNEGKSKGPAEGLPKPQRQNTTSDSGGDVQTGAQRTGTGLSGFEPFSRKSTTSSTVSEGKVKLFNSIKDDNGRVSPTKLLNVIVKNMTVTPATRSGARFTPNAPKQKTPSPASSVPESDSRPDSSGGVSLDGDDGGVALNEIPVIINWDNRPKQKPEHWIKFNVPYDRVSDNKVLEWNGGHSLSLKALEIPEAREERKKYLDGCVQPGAIVPFTIFLSFSEAMTEYDGQIGKDVKKSLDSIFREYGRHFDLQINLHFTFPQIQTDPEGATEAARVTANFTKIIVMVSQDEYAEKMQKKTDAMLAQALFDEDTVADRHGSKAREQRGRPGERPKQSKRADSGESDERTREREERLLVEVGQDYADVEGLSMPTSSGLRKHR